MQIVRSNIFKRTPEILFGMSTVDGGASNGKFRLNLSFNVEDLKENIIENRKRFFASLGILESQIAFTQQKHTANIAAVNRPDSIDNCDALHTNCKNIFLAISIADCTPVMLYDKKNQAVAGIHAGWRGTAGRIVEKTIKEMQKMYGTSAGDIIAFIAPSAGKCCYEVGAEVAEQFPKQCVTQNGSKKFYLDVKQANMIQLLENGVQNSNIEVHPDCTIHNHLYHSFRRDGNQSGRMFAIIGIKE